MVDQMVKTILQQVKEQYPGVAIPAGMRAVITSAEKSGETYLTKCKITDEATGKEYSCQVERDKYLYAVKIVDTNGSVLEEYPELIGIESRMEHKAGDMVQVVFLGNTLEAAILGG